MKKTTLISCVVAVALFVVPTAQADWFGGATQGPVRPGSAVADWWTYHRSDDLPPQGCSYIHSWSTGHYPVPGITTTYQFHVRLTYCWTASAWVQGEEYNASGRRITKAVIQTWWSDVRSVVHYDTSIQKRTVFYGCTLHGTYFASGCLYVRVQGQASVHVPPVVHIGDLTAHPWVKIRVAADGEFMGGDHDYSVL